METTVVTKIVTTCQKCPKIKGDTYCDLHKRTIWKEDEMCRSGYIERIYRGLDMCSKIYNAEPDDKDERIDKILQQVAELELLCVAKFPPTATEVVILNPEEEKYEREIGSKVEPSIPF